MGFLAPWFLGGLLALGVPVFAHLLKRHITVPRPVGSLMFFERGKQSSTRHRRLQYLLLFALRFALLLLVVLAFANPFVRRKASDPNGRLMLIVLDNSFSMRAGTRFADAKQAALALLAARPASQKAQVVALGGQVQMLTQPVSDAAQLRNALESIQPGDGHASFGELGRDIRTLNEQTHSLADLHLFSDMQKSRHAGELRRHGAARGDEADRPLRCKHEHRIAELDRRQRRRTGRTGRPERHEALARAGRDRRAQHACCDEDGIAAGERPKRRNETRRCARERQGDGRVFRHLTSATASVAARYVWMRATRFRWMMPACSPCAGLTPERVLFVRANGDSRSELYFGAALAAAAQASFTVQATSAAQTNDLDPSRFAFVVLADAVSLPADLRAQPARLRDKGRQRADCAWDRRRASCGHPAVGIERAAGE